ncbi:caspase-3-like [Mizuhopecten yessoensis]|uniref:Caspase-9 n=1 Tax=Mizuhopecten yessoensis TaxID=6573 RepID=A0A210PPU8_MIZYE|nr:caspase-3-like [Mizuhopecten yessoensis]OWF38497.1 Caspase-9 [Mizuhopecten yessoensis]
MAEEAWKEGIRKNFSSIIKEVANPDDLVEYFHHTITPPLLNDDQVAKIQAVNATKKTKTRSLINTLMYGDETVLSELVKGLRATKNENVAKLLEPYEEKLTQQRTKKLHLPPKVWPPSTKELDEMHEANIEQCDVADVSKSGYTEHAEVYTMTAKRRGLAVIINNKIFGPFGKANRSERTGTDLDRNKLSRVLSQLHFTVRIYNNVTSADMLKIAEESSTWQHHEESDCFVFVVLSHGCTSGIYGTDGNVVHVDNIVKNFNNENCPKLTGKPKIFLFQACRSSSEINNELNESGNVRPDCMETSEGSEASCQDNDDDDDDDDVSKAFENLPNDTDRIQADSGVDGGPNKQIKKSSHIASDFLFAYATPEGYRSYRNEKRGSWFIQAIVWVLKYNANKAHLQDLMTEVNRYVSTQNVQVSEIRTTLHKRLYFFPGVFNNPPEENDYIDEPETVKQ